MFKVLLADDESWVVESLKASINWEEQGFGVIGTAGNGSEALEMIQKLKPDLVFADIRMPGLNGLELIRKASEMGLETQFVIASGYAEFAYAQKAMNCGAVGYCLKPFDETEIIHCLAKVKKILEGRTQPAEQEFSGFMGPGRPDGEIAHADSSQINKILRQLEDSIKIKDLPAIHGCFGAFENLFGSGAYSIKHAYYTYNMVISLICRYINEAQETFIENYEQIPYMFENVNGMLQYLLESIVDQSGMKTENVPFDIGNKTMKEIIKYVDLNFNRRISIQSISRKFFVNPNYVSQLFKKEIGLNYTEYLTKIRIDFACQLLKESDLSVRLISERAGYNDYFYFTKAFKRITGRTPSEFRNERA